MTDNLSHPLQGYRSDNLRKKENWCERGRGREACNARRLNRMFVWEILFLATVFFSSWTVALYRMFQKKLTLLCFVPLHSTNHALTCTYVEVTKEVQKMPVFVGTSSGQQTKKNEQTLESVGSSIVGKHDEKKKKKKKKAPKKSGVFGCVCVCVWE